MTETLAWVRRKRLEFIEFRLIWYGKVNRSDLTDRFSMSPPQATGDLEKYREIAPDNMIYDPTERTFVRGPGFRRELTIGQSDRHLMQMEAIEHGFLDRSQTWFGDLPPVEVLELKRRPVADEVITVVADAIRQKRKLRGIYWTMSGKSPAARVLTPHAFACESPERIDDDRLARTGLAREQIEPGPKLDLERIDQGDVFDLEKVEH